MRDTAWFERLVRQNAELLLRYALRRTSADDAEDVVAETFVVVWRRRADVPDPPDDVLWLYGVARRQLANSRRARRRREQLRLRLGRERPPTAEPGEDGRAEAVREALDRLPAKDAELLRLLAWEGLSQRDAARVLGTTENAVALRAGRARRRLRASLDRFAAARDMEEVT
jgi:RNA polymerase sigma-70 factor (ECF subfamily)